MEATVAYTYFHFSGLVALACGWIFSFSDLARSVEAEENSSKVYVSMMTIFVAAYVSAKVIIRILIPRDGTGFYVLKIGGAIKANEDRRHAD